MAYNDTNLNDREEIIRQLGVMLPTLRMKRHPKTFALMETFDVWELDVNDLAQALDTNHIPAKPTSYQHHQIRLGRRVRAYALSYHAPGEAPEVIQVALSGVAERIDRAIERLDATVPDEISVRLVVVKSCGIYAFWMVEANHAYLISTPMRFRRLFNHLRGHRYLEAGDFLKLLYNAVEPFSIIDSQQVVSW
ncbi:MAG: hypothetical protein ACJ74G_19320 [Blastocatellia bacterium]